MKAYIYGYITAAGGIDNDKSSDGFSVTNNSTGVYTITFDSVIANAGYNVIATSNATSTPEVLTVGNMTNSSFKIYSWKLSDGSPRNTNFSFVVYKK